MNKEHFPKEKLNILLFAEDLFSAPELEMLTKALGHHVIKRTKQTFDNLQQDDIDLAVIAFPLPGHSAVPAIVKKLITNNIPVIYISNHNDPLLYEQAQKMNLLAFLVRPFEKLTLRAAIGLVEKQKRAKAEALIKNELPEIEPFFIRKQNQLIRIKPEDIYWIKSEGNYCFINTIVEKHVTKLSLTKLKSRLQNQNFIQIHKSYVINIKKIKSVSIAENQVFIENELLPVGRKFKQNLLKRIEIL